MVSDERRRSPRAFFCSDVEVVGYGSRRSTDLSAGGIFLEAIAGFPKDTMLQLRFKLQENDPSPIVVRGKVLYLVNGIGVGVQFVDLPPSDRARIERFVPV